MNLEDIKIPSWLIGIVLSVITSIVVFNASFASYQTKVEANTEKIKNTVTQPEFRAIVDGQNDRLNRIENKVDKLLERTK
jgi:hypothetical protein